MRRAGVLVTAGLCVLVLAAASMSIGAGDAGPGDVLDAVVAFDGSAAHVIVLQMRLPRTLVAVVAGLGLGVAGCVSQALTRNPLGDPGVLGVNAGAAFAVAIAVAVTGSAHPPGFVWWALVGAAVMATSVLLVGSAGDESTVVVRLTLTGVALGAVLAGATTAITVIFPTVFARLRDWSTGSIANTDLGVLQAVTPLTLAGVVVTVTVLRGLDLLSAGDATAVSLGVHLRRTNAVAVLAIALLAGSATAAAGPVLFFGLLVPHISRRLMGASLAWTVAGAAVIGPVVFLAADVLARVLLPSGELPVGLVTAALGAPLLIVLARRAVGAR